MHQRRERYMYLAITTSPDDGDNKRLVASVAGASEHTFSYVKLCAYVRPSVSLHETACSRDAAYAGI